MSVSSRECMWFVCLFVCLFVCSFVCLFVCLFVCVFGCLFVCFMCSFQFCIFVVAVCCICPLLGSCRFMLFFSVCCFVVVAIPIFDTHANRLVCLPIFPVLLGWTLELLFAGLKIMFWGTHVVAVRATDAPLPVICAESRPGSNQTSPEVQNYSVET